MIGFFARHPVAANLFLIAGLFLGLSAIGGMERETFPEFSASRVSITVAYPGATAQDVDQEICQLLDDSLRAVTGLDDMTCQSVPARASASLTMAEGGDITQFFNDIFSDVAALQDLPNGAEEPSVSIAGRTEQIALLAVSGLASDEALVRYAGDLAADLASLSGVVSATLRGVSTLEYRVHLDDVALQRYGLSPKDVADAISKRSTSSPLGTVETAAENYSLRIDGRQRSVADLKKLTIIEGSAGDTVRLSDVANVTLALADAALRSEIEGRQAAIITLNKTSDGDAIEAYATVESYLAKLRTQIGGDLELTIINNSTEVISDRITLVLKNALQSLALVFIIMCLFFSLRDALWISMALPFSFLLGLFIMDALGVTINVISVLALLMSIGIIMDDSIVIAENIDKWRDTLPPKEAAVKGTSEVMVGVVSSFLTTAAVFGPLMFLSGEIGSILKVIPIVLLVTLFASLIEAFLILPNHLSHAAPRTGDTRKRVIPRLLDALCDRGIVPLVTFMTRWRYATLGATIGAFILCIGLVTSGQVRLIGFPQTDADTLEIRISLTPGLQFDQTQSAVAKVLAGVEQMDARYTPGTNSAVPLVERVLVEYGRNSDVSNNGPHTATVTVDVLTSDARNVTSAELLSAVKEFAGAIPDLSQINYTTNSMTPGGSDIDISVMSQNLDDLAAASSELLNAMAARSDVRSVYSDFTLGQNEVQLTLTAYGSSLGLTTSGLSEQLRTSFTGTTTDTFRVGQTGFDVVVSQPDVAESLTALRALPVTLPSGEQAALSRVAEISEASTFSQITRENGLARARIVGEIDRNVQIANGISEIALKQLAPDIAATYPNVTFSIGGATESQAETQGSIFNALALGLVVVYLVLAFQFRSYVLPIFIMTSIPFALIGVILGHLAIGIDLSMPSIIGFASLAGIVVNNAILFVTFFEQNARDTNHVSAAVEAMRRRFRPVFLASLTTFIGLLPVVFETSPSLVTIVPVVVSVAFGVLASLVLVVLVFPAVLAAYFDFANVERWIEGGRPTPEKGKSPS